MKVILNTEKVIADRKKPYPFYTDSFLLSQRKEWLSYQNYQVRRLYRFKTERKTESCVSQIDLAEAAIQNIDWIMNGN